ncbi:MAG: alpha/beta fold hydrolase [Clostridia bacterium]|nr:alpha/beta fold hydrolase [Clostridia bacterium]
MRKEFYLQDDGIRLHAKLDKPDHLEKCPLALVIHGLTGHMEEDHIIAVCEGMWETGFATLRVEMFGHGQSEGDFARHNLYKWLNNAMCAAEYARSLDFVTDLYLCGHSQGGLTTILLAGMMPDYFKAILPLAPAIVITDGAKKGQLLGQTFDPMHVPVVFSWGTHSVNGTYIRVAQTLDTDAAIRRYTGPVLIVHGDADEAVPLFYARDAASKYRDCELVVIPDDDHCYHRHLGQVVEAVKAFLVRVSA